MSETDARRLLQAAGIQGSDLDTAYATFERFGGMPVAREIGPDPQALAFTFGSDASRIPMVLLSVESP